MVTKDTIKFDTIPINPQNFKVLDRQKKILYPTEYTIIYNRALLIIDATTYKEITIEYFKYPEFIKVPKGIFF